MEKIFPVSLSFFLSFPRPLKFTDTFIFPQPSLKLGRYLVIYRINYISLPWTDRKSFSTLSSSYLAYLVPPCHVEHYDRLCHEERNFAIAPQIET